MFKKFYIYKFYDVTISMVTLTKFDQFMHLGIISFPIKL